ncbi:TetR/AcrR family transcriptional regulator [Naumannella halotolerans]|uniref:AcrR family transcriptional regulator n=1 Tax=Naumannella halotolerans TaxID=993414 RepID=A0A4R7J8A2_9ACTN|nr:TetR/AcrR family transcriptional regulator [Naumannella halotolerans]TDT33711.1 AcrR family transcriptional regulator [Naumannella halotolerans]
MDETVEDPDAYERPSQRTRLPREQRRQQLLEVAGAVFSTKGYHATVMDDIAEAAGVSKPVLYQHFPSKLELYFALLDSSAEQVISMISLEMQSTEDNAERVTSAISAFFNYVNDNQAFRLIFESDLIPDPQVSDRFWQMHTRLAEAVGEVIAIDTRLPAEEGRLLGVSLVGMAQVGARYWVNEESGISRERAIELLSTLAWRGIRGFPRVRTSA